MAKQLNVNLAFTADTNKAKSSVMELQNALNKIANTSINNDLGLKEASEAAKALSYHLNQAYNATTGNIDLNKLNHSLEKSSTNVTDLSNKLLQAGAVGQQAFIGLAKSISNADYPMFKLNAKLSEMLTTLKNTARWQLSSSVLHGFMGAVQEAYGYVQDLNESLVNIQVVTGKNADEMARFAEQANRAAKNLGTRTTDYTNASLIYYQQGLDEEEVLKRADITVKMANVAGVSAEVASDQLTAVWNNFAKTGDNLEYYADVMTALGAATASSTDEIAGGLEKFAAIADTIGLSYEYAASALATITSNTRQSEEVVGTALKTIFARIQGLNLGETLDDGTTLNKYSEALDKVGISIFEQNGEIKKMDAILDEMGAKWQTIAKDEQIALAQTVAGVRQYNQLISLMDNWDVGDSDSMLANLETAYNATGALQQQADIWGKSWEAASNRVATAAQGIYDSLLDDKLFINFNNVFADMLSGVEQVIDGVGGLKGVLIGVSSFFLSLMSHKIQPVLTEFILNIKSMFQSAQNQAAALVGEIQSKTSQELSNGDYTTAEQQELKNASLLTEARTRLTVVSKELTDQEKQLYEMDIGMMELSTQKAQNIASEITALEKERDTIYQSVDATKERIAVNDAYEQELNSLIVTQRMWRELLDAAYEDGGTSKDQMESAEEYEKANQAIDEYINSKQILNEIIQQTTQAIMDEYTEQEYANDSFEQGKGVLQAFTQNLNAMSAELGKTNRKFTPDEVDKYKRELNLLSKTFEQMRGISASAKKELAQLFSQAKVSKGSKELQNNISQIITKIQSLKFTSEDLKQMGISLSPTQFQDFLTNLDQGTKKEKELITVQEELQRRLDTFNPIHMVSGLERIVSLASSLGSIAMAGQSISAMINSWNNTDLSFGEKLATTLTSISMIIPGIISSFKGLRTVISGTSIETTLYNLALKQQGLTQKEINGETVIALALGKQKKADKIAEATITGVLVTALKAENIEITKEEAAKLKGLIASKLREGASLKEAIATALVTLRSGDAKKAINAETAAKVADKAATDALNISIKSLLGPIGLAIAAITAIISGFKLWSDHMKEAAENARELAKANAEMAMEMAAQTKEEHENYKSLYEEYIKNKISLDNSETSKQALRQATDDLCEALGAEWDALDRLQGKYEDVNKEIAKKAVAQAEEDIKTTQDTITAVGRNMLIKNTGDTYEWEGAQGTNKSWEIGYQDDSIFANRNEEKFVVENITKAMLGAGFKEYDDYMGLPTGDFRIDQYGMRLMSQDAENDYEIDIDTYLKAYETIRDEVNRMAADKSLTQEQLSKSELYMGLQQWVKNNEEDYNRIIELREDLVNYGDTFAQAKAALTNLDIVEVSNWEEYSTYRDEYIQSIRSVFEKNELIPQDIQGNATKIQAYFEDLADTYLGGYNHIADIVTEHNIMTSIKEKSNIPDDVLDIIASEYEDFLTLSAKIDFDKVASEQELRNILDILQAQTNATKIQTQIDVVHAAKGNLKENMTLTDYNDFKTESGINWGEFDETLNKEIISYGEFLQLAYSQQIEYLDDLEQSYIAKQTSGIQKTITDSQNLLTSYKNELNALLEDQSANGATVEGLTRIEELKSLINALEQYIPTLNETSAAINNSLASSVSESFSEAINSLDDLHAKTQQLKDSGIEVSLEEYGSALVELAGNYDNCIDEIDDYNKALLTEDKDQIQAASSALELAIEIGELSKKFNLNAKEIEAYSKRLKNSLNISEQAANKLAIANSRVDRGLLDLNKNFDTYTKALKENAEGTATWSSTMDSVKANLADIFNIDDGSMLSDSFVQSIINSEELKLALDGDIASIEHLQALAADDIIINIVANQSETPEDIRAAWEQLKIDFASTDIDAPSIDQTNLINSFNDLIAKGQMTKEQIEAALSGLHVSANVKTNYVAQRVTVPTTITDQSRYITGYDEIDTNMDGELESVARWRTVTATHTGEPVTVDGWVPQYTIEGTEGDGEIRTAFTSAPSISVSTSSTTSGMPKESGGKSSKPAKPRNSEKRYDYSDAVIDDIKEKIEDKEREIEKAAGEAKITAMKELAELNKELQQAYMNQKAEAINLYLDTDKTAVETAFEKLKVGLGLDNALKLLFDESGNNIVNYNEIAKAADAVYNSMINDTSEAGRELLDQYGELIDAWEDAVDQHKDTVEYLEDLDDKIKELDIKLYDEPDDIETLSSVEYAYADIDEQLRRLERTTSRAQKEVSQLYGANQIAAIDKVNDSLRKENELLQQKIERAKQQLEVDKKMLQTELLMAQTEMMINANAAAQQLQFEFDTAGSITNLEAVMDSLIQKYNELVQTYMESKQQMLATNNGIEEWEKEKLSQLTDQISQFKTYINNVTTAVQAYNNTLQMIETSQDAIMDNEDEIKANNYDKLVAGLNANLDVTESSLKMIDYYLNKMSDDFYSMAEAAQLMMDKIPLIEGSLGSYESFYNNLEAAFAAGEITQADYVAGLKDSYQGILSNLEALNELDKEMMHYYEDTLAAGAEELAHYTDQMEHLTSVLDHYHNLIVLINGEYDYDSIGTVLEGKATTLKNEMDVAQANYQMLLEQKAMIQSHYDNAVDENARELHANELKAITAMVDEAHEVLLSKTEEWAKVQKAIMENVMAEAAREMEMAFTNGMGFDALNDSLGRLSATADIYLTKTNQIYETQTLINTAQKAIDKTTNNAAKIRLKNYQEEIELLQDKNKLTKVELDIAKAKYDVLLAEIALEEAQNAKATVRLQRDNEGNYGYVYTADQQQVAEAEQTLLDTQNELYNIRLEAANEYGQKIMELNQQLADDLMALEQARVDGQFATEAEYQAAKEKIIAEYTELYKGYSASYTAATSEDARIEEEAWVTAYEGIINSADNWKNHIRIYTRECENAYSEYRSVVQSESSVINNLLGDVQGSVKDVTNESNNLKNKVIHEVIPAIRNQYTQVAQVTAAYAAQRTGILNLISAYEQLAQSILRAIQAQANLNALESTPAGPTTPKAPTSTNRIPTNTNQTPTNNTSETAKNQKATAIALKAQEIVTKVHTGVIPMHSSGLGWQPSAREMGYDEDSIKVALQAFNDSKPGAGWDYYYDKALELAAARYNTGGYTGAWGPYGRMAILDEKELVLNQRDTENFLMATEILRGIVDTIDFNSLHSQFSQLSSTGLLSMNPNAFEQNVSIEAHFPNVNDRNEIEEAFNNLINTASQYANRKF